jgi:hypothetical protein
VIVLGKSSNSVVESEVNEMWLNEMDLQDAQDEFNRLYKDTDVTLGDSPIKAEDMIVASIYKMREEGYKYNEIRKIYRQHMAELMKDERYFNKLGRKVW